MSEPIPQPGLTPAQLGIITISDSELKHAQAKQFLPQSPRHTECNRVQEQHIALTRPDTMTYFFQEDSRAKIYKSVFNMIK